MGNPEYREIRVPLNDGRLATIRVREKDRRTENGKEVVVLALLHPDSLIEVGEYCVPIIPVCQRVVGGDGVRLDALDRKRRPARCICYIIPEF